MSLQGENENTLDENMSGSVSLFFVRCAYSMCSICVSLSITHSSMPVSCLLPRIPVLIQYIYIYIFSVLYLLFSFLRVFVCLVNCLSHPSLSSFLACVISASRLQCSCAPGLPLQCTTPFKIKQSTRSAEHTVHNKLAAAENAKFTTNPDYEWRTVLPMSG